MLVRITLLHHPAYST